MILCYNFNLVAKDINYSVVGLCWPGYLNLGEDPSKVIWSQDFSLGAYNENMFVKFVKDLNDNYPGAGTQGPVRYGVTFYGFSYYWPGKTPLPPMGNVSTLQSSVLLVSTFSYLLLIAYTLSHYFFCD